MGTAGTVGTVGTVGTEGTVGTVGRAGTVATLDLQYIKCDQGSDKNDGRIPGVISAGFQRVLGIFLLKFNQNRHPNRPPNASNSFPKHFEAQDRSGDRPRDEKE